MQEREGNKQHVQHGNVMDQRKHSHMKTPVASNVAINVHKVKYKTQHATTMPRSVGDVVKTMYSTVATLDSTAIHPNCW